jgi:sugar phosphate isomerase/epimerase
MKNEQSRRDFLKTGLVAASFATMFSSDLFAKPKTPVRHIGLQLWSVKDDMAADPKGTLAKLAKMGYKEVEGFGYKDGKLFGLTVSEFAAELTKNGLKMPSFHQMVTSADYTNGVLSDSFKKAMADLKLMGVESSFVPYMIDADRLKAKEMANIFNVAAKYCQTLGMKFGYHNHDFEFKEYNGEMLYKTLLENTDKNLVHFEMDLYWVVVAGQQPVEWFKKHPGRFPYVHVKDHDPLKKVSVEVGEGDINFQTIFNQAKLGGIKHFVIELEAYKRTPLEGVEIGLNNLKKLKF